MFVWPLATNFSHITLLHFRTTPKLYLPLFFNHSLLTDRKETQRGRITGPGSTVRKRWNWYSFNAFPSPDSLPRAVTTSPRQLCFLVTLSKNLFWQFQYMPPLPYDLWTLSPDFNLPSPKKWVCQKHPCLVQQPEQSSHSAVPLIQMSPRCQECWPLLPLSPQSLDLPHTSLQLRNINRNIFLPLFVISILYLSLTKSKW